MFKGINDARLDIVEGHVGDRHAVFFDRINQIVPFVQTLLDHPCQIEAMTSAAREHVRRYHTTTARAEYFLTELGLALTHRQQMSA